jgi:pimeloyl-ACP methyl ester carboxylesterase
MSESWQPSQPYPYKEMKLRSGKGLIYGVLWLAPNAKGTVLYSHGNGDNIADSQKSIPQFIKLGYNILIWDYRGYGRSTGKLDGQDGLLSDAESVYQWLNSRGYAGGIVLYGYSLGSGIALYLAHRHPGHEVLLEAAYDSLTSVAQDHFPVFPVKLILKYPMPAALWAADVIAPVLIVHGTRDTVIPPDHAVALAKVAPNAALTLIKDGGHYGLSNSPQYAGWLKRALLLS